MCNTKIIVGIVILNWQRPHNTTVDDDIFHVRFPDVLKR